MTTTAPNRGSERPVPETRERSDRTRWSKAVMLLNVVLIAGVVIIGLSHVGQRGDAGWRRGHRRPGRSRRRRCPTRTPSRPRLRHRRPRAGPRRRPACRRRPRRLRRTRGIVQAPRIRPTMRSNFAKGDGWPVGAGFRETGAARLAVGHRRPADDPRPGRGRQRGELAREVDEGRRTHDRCPGAVRPQPLRLRGDHRVAHLGARHLGAAPAPHRDAARRAAGRVAAGRPRQVAASRRSAPAPMPRWATRRRSTWCAATAPSG